MLTRDAIFAARDRAFEDVDVPEWGGMVRIAVITGTDRDAYEASMYEMKGKEIKLNRDNMRAKLLARAIVDENLKRIFTDADIRFISSVIQNYLHFLLKDGGDFGRITSVIDLDFLPSLRL